jgi:hypothetical protein
MVSEFIKVKWFEMKLMCCENQWPLWKLLIDSQKEIKQKKILPLLTA